ncbi:fucolectin-like [Branchiostoma lanceolatum]|uniref:fucolectin-like n=1 Tax=Branchiostoma lanceolatum TaxID=7740 RepID=UPI0034571283
MEMKQKIKELEMQNKLPEEPKQPDDTCIKTDDMTEVLDIVRDLKRKFERMESEQNIARDKPTVQSSTAHRGFSNRAVDGSANTFWAGKSCTHTEQNVKDPWWYVDLLAPYPIGIVKIYNRQDCCTERINPFIVLVGDNGRHAHAAPLTYTKQCGGEWGSDYTDKGVFYIDCGGIRGRYVSVKLPGNERTLTLCEVEVYAAKNPEVEETG